MCANNKNTTQQKTWQIKKKQKTNRAKRKATYRAGCLPRHIAIRAGATNLKIIIQPDRV
jgi:hypothetical protein